MTPFEQAEISKQLLANPILKKAFVDIREGLVSQLETVPFHEIDTQHELALMLKLLNKLKTQIQSYIQDSVVSEHRRKQDSFMERIKERLT